MLIAPVRTQTGACIVYTPEGGINLDMLRDDVKYLKKRYSLDAKGKAEGRIVLKCVSIICVLFHLFSVDASG